jgi:hypothetical protein
VLRLKQLLAGHQRFCEQQLANKKTARVLEVAFDEEVTEAYMTQVAICFKHCHRKACALGMPCMVLGAGHVLWAWLGFAGII